MSFLNNFYSVEEIRQEEKQNTEKKSDSHKNVLFGPWLRWW